MAAQRREKSPRARPTSPGVLELDGDFEHRLLHVRGVRLHFAEAGSTDNPLIVLLHGTVGGWFDYRHVIAALAKKGHHVAAVDMRGYGLSDKPPARFGHDLDSAIGDIVALIRSLGHHRAWLAGADSGGAVAWAAAIRHPERIAGLISIAATHPLDMRLAMRRRPLSFQHELSRRVLGPWGLQSLQGLRHKSADSEEMQRATLAAATSSAYQATKDFDQSVELRTAAARLTSTEPAVQRNNRLVTTAVPAEDNGTLRRPVLALQPEDGIWAHLLRLQRARVGHAEKNFDVSSIPGSYLLPHLEQPDAFTRDVAGFIAKH